jgi:hypothetical protein
MRKLVLFLMSVMFGVAPGFSQEMRVDLTGEPGPYTVAQWKKQWPGCEYEDGVAEGRVELVQDGAAQWLRTLYPKGSHGADLGGAGWRFPLRRELVLTARYDLMFEPDFDFVKGGKLPGLCGGKKTITGGDAVDGREGWSARVMWRKDGRGQAYVYHMNQPSKYGDEFDFPKSFHFEKGKTYTIALRVEMNSVGKRDGKLMVWVNDEKLVERLDMEWRALEDIGVNGLLFNTFHGGSGESWAPSRDCHARFGNFSWSK